MSELNKDLGSNAQKKETQKILTFEQSFLTRFFSIINPIISWWTKKDSLSKENNKKLEYDTAKSNNYTSINKEKILQNKNFDTLESNIAQSSNSAVITEKNSIQSSTNHEKQSLGSVSNTKTAIQNGLQNITSAVMSSLNFINQNISFKKEEGKKDLDLAILSENAKKNFWNELNTKLKNAQIIAENINDYNIEIVIDCFNAGQAHHLHTKLEKNSQHRTELQNILLNKENQVKNLKMHIQQDIATKIDNTFSTLKEKVNEEKFNKIFYASFDKHLSFEIEDFINHRNSSFVTNKESKKISEKDFKAALGSIFSSSWSRIYAFMQKTHKMGKNISQYIGSRSMKILKKIISFIKNAPQKFKSIVNNIKTKRGAKRTALKTTKNKGLSANQKQKDTIFQL